MPARIKKCCFVLQDCIKCKEFKVTTEGVMIKEDLIMVFCFNCGKKIELEGEDE